MTSDSDSEVYCDSMEQFGQEEVKMTFSSYKISKWYIEYVEYNMTFMYKNAIIKPITLHANKN